MNAFDVTKVVRKVDGGIYCTISTVDTNGTMMIISRASASDTTNRPRFATPIALRGSDKGSYAWYLSKDPYLAGKHVTHSNYAYTDSLEIVDA